MQERHQLVSTIQHREAAQRTLVTLQLRLGSATQDVRRAITDAHTIVHHDARDIVDPCHAINEQVVQAMFQVAELLESLELRTSLLVGRESGVRLSNISGGAA